MSLRDFRRAAAGLVLGGLAATPAVACPLTDADGRPVSGGAVQAAWQVVGPGRAAAIEASRHFSLQVRLCPAGAELLAVDATMPAHRHGMNYRPSLHPLGDGRWRVDGLLFHMSGAWELVLDVRLGERRERLRQAIDLP